MVLITTISQFLSSDGGQTMYWTCAIIGSAFFGISGILNLFGIGDVSGPDDVDFDANVDVPHVDTGFLDFKLLSLKSILAFVMMFGWGGVVFGRDNGYAGLAGALACGIVTMILTALLIAFLLKLQQDGTRDNASLVGLTGRVYLTIPAGRTSAGKVIVNAENDTREVAAFADESIPTGTQVRLMAQFGRRGFVVERIESENQKK